VDPNNPPVLDGSLLISWKDAHGGRCSPAGVLAGDLNWKGTCGDFVTHYRVLKAA
jgi:hypothetical protein